jgi:hypothetical protein
MPAIFASHASGEVDSFNGVTRGMSRQAAETDSGLEMTRSSGAIAERADDNYVVKSPAQQRDPGRALPMECPLFQVFMRSRRKSQAAIEV